MNTLPILALGILASGYAVATEQLDRRFDTIVSPTVTAYPASDDLAVYDVLGHGAQPMDQPHCDLHADLTETLEQDFAEVPIEERVAADDLVMELWASEVMGTWTMVHRGADGVSCIVSSGTGWRSDWQADEVFNTIAPGV
ncbi:hypothetical protein [Pseudotabrizicola sp. L79]|uniref:hypothetical protein n=1 Tax=Pseudotabrizicola sp. L79 TaxID=3118402 RepID=UPI002F92DED3